MTIKNEESLQSRFLSKVKNLIPPSQNIVDVLSDLLEISTDSTYRRLREETSLTIDDIEKICKHFRISFEVDEGMDSGSVTFKYGLLKNIDEFRTYLTSIRDDLIKIRSVKEKKIFYAAVDVPVFYNFKYWELGLFKVYYWMKSVIHDQTFDSIRFQFHHEFDDLLKVGREIYDLYTQIPSVEIWNEGTITSLIKQIEYVWDSGFFNNPEDAIIICEQVKDLLNLIQKQAEYQTKHFINDIPIDNEGSYSLYTSETEIGNNCILVTLGELKTVYLTHNTFNKIITINPKFCQETEDWMNNMAKKSVLISGVSEKQRYQFFRNAQLMVKNLQEKIIEQK
jgi:hypothetical protein